MSQQNQFPDGFLWGASTSAHQVEGGMSNDWSDFEESQAEKLAEEAHPNMELPGRIPHWNDIEKFIKSPDNYRSGTGVDFVHRWREDFKQAAELGMSAIRFSVEWSKVEPQEGHFDETEIARYVQMAEYARELGMTPFVTLHHFTNPKWFAAQGGWESSHSPAQFARYAEKMITAMHKTGTFWIVFNEPEILVAQGWVFGKWLPRKKLKLFAAFKVYEHFIATHRRVYKIAKKIDSSAQISSTINNTFLDPVRSWRYPLNLTISLMLRFGLNRYFLYRTYTRQDFIAINHYLHCRIDGGLFKNLPERIKSDLGWMISPESLARVVHQLRWYKKPIYITEHGVADAFDTLRPRLLKDSLLHLRKAVDEGARVKGYLHWSLLDNFEWDKGWWPKFGLIEVDRETMERRPRSSTYTYKSIIRSNGAKLD